MDLCKYIFVFSVLLCLGCANSKKFPPYIELCHVDDPKIDDCLLKAVAAIKPHLLEGVPELLIPPMNPLIIPQADLNSGDNFKASFKNIEIYYVNEFELNYFKFDLKNLHVELGLTFPRLRIKSQYNIDGRILILELKGRGPADGNFTNVVANLVGDGSFITKNNQKYINLAKTHLDLKIGKPVFRFDGLFGDNQELNDQTNKVFNENVEDMVEELRPVIDSTVTEIALGLVGRIFNKFSFNELFPK